MAKISSFRIVLPLIIIFILPSIGLPYMLPPAQILQYMTNKFANIKTLKIIQRTSIKELSEEKEKVFGEIIYLKTPDLYRSEIAGQPGKRLIILNSKRTLRIINRRITYDRQGQDFLYRFLFLAQNTELLLERLAEAGINLDKASLTRFEGRIAYLIGEKKEGSPKLLVDKKLFLPLVLKYGDFLFHFSDYREIREHIWYPYKITCSSKGAIIEEYTLKDIMMNPLVDVSLFDIPLIRSQFEKSELKPDKQ